MVYIKPRAGAKVVLEKIVRRTKFQGLYHKVYMFKQQSHQNIYQYDEGNLKVDLI